MAAPAIAQEDGDDEDEDEPGAQIRLVHGVADGPAVDVYIGGERVLQEVEPGSVVEYQEVEAGNHTIVMVAAEDPGGVVLETTFEAEERGNYTVAAAGQFDEGDGEIEPAVLLDNATQPPGELASVRLAHLVRGAPDVTVTLNETDGVVFESVSFGNSSMYRTIPEGDYTFDIRAGGADGEIIQSVDADLTGGQATSLLAIGAEDENETLQVLQQTDPIGPEDLSPDIVPEPDGDAADETDDTDDNATDDTDANETDGIDTDDIEVETEAADDEDAADEEDEEDAADDETDPDVDVDDEAGDNETDGGDAGADIGLNGLP
ncbi:DUF4397 domain-containing protein [Halorientalis halophila]|uniref:DUF4397 domain-containing protein n=1 Tax=Halorientalis halophila TaxID=3108499 RepID=UPI0030081D69